MSCLRVRLLDCANESFHFESKSLTIWHFLITLFFFAKVFPKTWGGKSYEKVFEGSSLVDRVVEKSPERYSTREKATVLLQGVLEEGFIKSIGRSRLFEDGSQLFYWTETSQSLNNMATTVNARTQVRSLLCCNQIIMSRLMIGHDTTPSYIRAPLP